MDTEHVANLPWREDEWQKQLQEAVSDPGALLALLNLDPKCFSEIANAAKPFKLRVPRGFIARMRKNDPCDPLLMQVLPIGREVFSPEGYIDDPLGEKAKNTLPGLLHKYPNRVLLMLAIACPVHCRYCFRREFNYKENNPNKRERLEIFDYIRSKSEIDEVILSGGDPLMASDSYLSEYIKNIESIPHVKRLRIHTRFPVVLPERVTNAFIKALKSRLKTVLVIHVNHPNEIDHRVGIAVQALRNAEIVLLNQSVLLKGINDSTQVLKNLSEKLFEVGVLPYYLHLLDKVKGASHFAVSDETAREIMAELITCLPGYLVPKCVREEAGKLSKTGFM